VTKRKSIDVQFPIHAHGRFFTRVGLNECVFSPFISSHTHNKTQFEDAAPFNPTSLHNRNAGTHIFKGLLSPVTCGASFMIQVSVHFDEKQSCVMTEGIPIVHTSHQP